jgi:hypothetical protein
VTVTPKLNDNVLTPFKETLCFVIDHKYNEKAYSELLGNGFYAHGKAGMFDEIDYEDDDPDNQIKPTK